jgi:uncharacterized protein
MNADIAARLTCGSSSSGSVETLRMIASERLYPIRRPLAAVCAGACVAVLGGLIGLGGAEFRLPVLIAVFALYPHRAIRINLLISLATLAMSAVARLSFLHSSNVADFKMEIAGMLAGGIVAAWFGAGYLRRIPKTRIMGVIAGLLLATAVLLAAETLLHGVPWTALATDTQWRWLAAICAGLLVGTVSSLLGVAGGELIIPILIFVFGADIRTAGTASVLISIPVVLTGVGRHWLTGHYRSQSILVYLVLPMAVGSALGAIVGGYLAAWAPTDALRLLLATILAVSALKLWTKSGPEKSN